jgi:hypothetical protein
LPTFDYSHITANKLSNGESFITTIPTTISTTNIYSHLAAIDESDSGSIQLPYQSAFHYSIDDSVIATFVTTFHGTFLPTYFSTDHVSIVATLIKTVGRAFVTALSLSNYAANMPTFANPY